MRPFSIYAARHPLSAAIIATLFLSLAFLWPLLFLGPVDVTGGTGQISYDPDFGTSLFQGLAAGLVVLVAAAMGWMRQTGLIGEADPAGLRLFAWIIAIPFGFYVLLVAGVVAYPDTDTVFFSLVAAIIFALFIGLSEELMFRGILLHGLRQRVSPGWALIISATLFGLYHGANAFYGQDLVHTALQILFATGFGALLAALTLQTVSLWPAIVLHALWNLNVFTGMMIDHDAMDPYVTDAAETPAVVPPAWSLLTGAAVQFLLFSTLAWVIYRRWRRRMALDSAAQQA